MILRNSFAVSLMKNGCTPGDRVPLEDPQSALQTLFSTWTSMKSNCIRLRKIATHRYENTSTTRTFHLHQGPKRDRSRPTTTGTLTWPGQHWAARNDRSDAELACPHFARSPSRKDLKHFGYSSAHMLTGTRKNWTICSSYGPRVLGGVHG